MLTKKTQTLVVLAGGFGTRLSGVINSLPKALAPIGSKPFLEIQMRNWKAQGVRSFIFLLHHQADQIIDFLKLAQKEFFSDCTIKWVIEEMPLGTGGAIVNALKVLKLQGNFLLTNADTWLDSNFHEMTLSKAPSMLVVKVLNCARYGSIELDVDNRVLHMREKEAIVKAGMINAGLYHLNSELFLEFDSCPMSLESELFPKLVQNRLLNAVSGSGKFLDIGVPEDYFNFCEYAKAKGLDSA